MWQNTERDINIFRCDKELHETRKMSCKQKSEILISHEPEHHLSKYSFTLHQSTTYENSYKMMTSEVMLWWWPNDNLLKIINFVKVIECEKSFGLDHVLETDHNNKRRVLRLRRFIEAK